MVEHGNTSNKFITMSFPKVNNEWLEEHALFKQPKKGKCNNSQFVNGYHRIGYIPKTCPNDGASKGKICHEICLDCGKKFKRSLFVI